MPAGAIPTAGVVCVQLVVVSGLSWPQTAPSEAPLEERNARAVSTERGAVAASVQTWAA